MFGKMITWLLPLMPRALVRRVAGPYIAGTDSAAAIAVAARLQEQGWQTTVDRLGEETANWEQADREVASYLELMEAMVRAGVERNVSLKLTQLGLRLDPERTFAGLRRILEKAAAEDFFVRIDMEDSTVTDVTLELHRRAREVWHRVGTVLQARLHRTGEDAGVLADEGAHIRLCKGIYPETGAIAHQDGGAINRAYLACADRLLAGSGRLALATHDAALARQLVERVGRDPAVRERVEFQALLGVPAGALLNRLRSEGFPVRVYIPYGEDWYGYSIRRLQENPGVAWAVTKGLFRRGRVGA